MDEAVELRVIPGDHPLIAQVEDLCYRTLHEPFGVSRQDDWDQMDPGSTHLVAVVNGAVIGYARLLDEGGWGHIRQVGVEPEWRRRGIATMLVKELVEIARQRGMRRLYLNSRLPAVPVYERAGFHVVSPEPFPSPRTYLPHVRMELDLGV